MTEYVVLKKLEGQKAWTEVERIETPSRELAIARVATKQMEKDDVDTADYNAVPARSWDPVTLKREVQTRISVAKDEEPEPEEKPDEGAAE